MLYCSLFLGITTLSSIYTESFVPPHAYGSTRVIGPAFACFPASLLPIAVDTTALLILPVRR